MISKSHLFRVLLALFLGASLILLTSVSALNGSGTYGTLSTETGNAEPEVIWEHTYGGTLWDWCSDMIEVSSGGFAMTGEVDAPWAGEEGKMGLIVTDAMGNQLWNQTFRNAGASSSSGSSLVECDDGFLIGGMIQVAGTNYDMWLVKTDMNGNHIWNRTYGGHNVWKIVECSDGGYALFGPDFYVVRLDTDCNELWSRNYEKYRNDMAQGFAQCSDGGFAIVGNTKGNLSSYCVLLDRIDADGNPLWNRTYEVPQSNWASWDCGMDILPIETGYIIVALNSYYGMWLIAVSTTGNIIWTHSYAPDLLWHHSSGIGSGQSIIRCSNGGFAIAGFGWSRLAGVKFGGSGFLFRIDESGNLLWDQTYSRSDRDEIYAIVECSDGGFAMAGQTAIDWNESDFDFWLLRVADAPSVSFPRVVGICLGLGFAVVLAVVVLRRKEI